MAAVNSMESTDPEINQLQLQTSYISSLERKQSDHPLSLVSLTEMVQIGENEKHSCVHKYQFLTYTPHFFATSDLWNSAENIHTPMLIRAS